MKPIHLMFALAIAPSMFACSSAQKKPSHEVDLRPTDTLPDTRKSEPATGELREALIMLHRIHFAYDSATLKPDARAALSQASGPLRDHPDVHLYVDGHTDSRGDSAYNVTLGERRAKAVVDALARLGVDRDRLHVVSYGETAPLVQGQGPVALASNRRTEFRLYRGDARIDLEDGVLYDDRGLPLGARSSSR